jgi:hypothetical protein
MRFYAQPIQQLFINETSRQHAEAEMWIEKKVIHILGDNFGDNPLSYPHMGDNLVDRGGIT